MLHKEKNTDDLEYLAAIGFDTVKTTPQDIDDLISKARQKVFSYNNGFYFGLISLLVGVFIGISIFFMAYSPSENHAISKKKLEQTVRTKNTPDFLVKLDTISVTENFSKPATHEKLHVSQNPAILQDTSIIISSMPTATISEIPATITEAQVKYIPNSPVIYIHDLKISDYPSLYFRKNKFVTLTVKGGLDPSYANPSEVGKNDNVLLPQANYYLHQAISDAMLYFSRKEYRRCLNTLALIEEINPSDINCKFYTGMCHYYQENYKTAQKYFDDCINHPNNAFLNEARYYKACALYYGGGKSEALDLLREIASENSFYSEKAKQFLK